MTGTPQTVSSATSSTRPRKAAKGNGWTMEHTYDSVGQKKEVIVIDDSQTPEHPPRKRTRAQVAAENAAAAAGAGAGAGTSAQGYAQPQPYGRTSVNGPNGHHLSNGHAAASVPSTSSAGKKRKVDDGSDAAAKKKGKASGVSLHHLLLSSVCQVKSWLTPLLYRPLLRSRHYRKARQSSLYHLATSPTHGTMPRVTISSAQTTS